MAPLAHLEALEAIRLLKARYFRYVDQKAWGPLAALFTPDATLHFVHRTPDPEPAAVAIARMAHVLQHAVSVHHGHMPEIEIIDETNATGVWAMEDRLWFSDAHPYPFGIRRLTGYGHYHERYERRDGVWLIATLRLDRLHVLSEPAG